MRRVIFWCALNIPSAPGVSQTLCDTSLVLPSASHCCTAALSCFYNAFYEEIHHHHHLPESWAQQISATVTWNVTRLSENLARHVFLVPREYDDDLMVGS